MLPNMAYLLGNHFFIVTFEEGVVGRMSLTRSGPLFSLKGHPKLKLKNFRLYFVSSDFEIFNFYLHGNVELICLARCSSI